MQLFLIRHAEAVPRDAEVPDPERPLTAKGMRRWKRAVRGLARLGVGFDRVYHSPWLRAAQTAERLGRLVDGETIALRELAGRPTPALLARIEGGRVALVGHQPWLGELVGLLVHGSVGFGDRLEIEKGALVWLDGTLVAGGMTVKALLPPQVLRAARRS